MEINLPFFSLSSFSFSFVNIFFRTQIQVNEIIALFFFLSPFTDLYYSLFRCVFFSSMPSKAKLLIIIYINL